MMSNTVRWGVLGNAMIARDYVIPAIQAVANSEFAAIASRNELEDGIFTGVKKYVGYDSLLDDADIDAVYIPLPNALHSEWSIRAMRKGKHVLCEKPMALNSKQCCDMIHEAEINKVLLMEAFMYRYNEKTKFLISILDSKELGTIKGMHCHFGYTLDWISPPRQDPDLGGGCLYDVGCYCVDVMNLIMCKQGETCIDASATFKEADKVDHHASGWLKYSNGSTGTFDSWFDAYLNQELTIFGENGVLRIPSPFHDTLDDLEVTTKNGTRIIPVTKCNSYERQVEAFADAVLHKENRLLELSDTLSTINTLDMLYSNRHTM